MKVVNPFRKLEFYSDIDFLPIANWFKIQETNDVTWLMLKRRSCTKSELAILQKVMSNLTDQYIDSFGLSPNYKRILELKRDIRVKEIKYYLTKDKSILTFIEVDKHSLRALLGTDKKSDYGSVRVHVAKYMGGADFKTMSVKFFYEILKEMKKEFKAKSKK